MAASPYASAPGLDVAMPNNLLPTGSSTGSRSILDIERAKASFDTEDLALFVYGRVHLDRLERILAIVEQEPAFSKKNLHYLGREEKFDFAVRKEKRFAQMIAEHGWDDADIDMAEMLVDILSVFHLHRAMWMKTIRDQGTDEQHKLFLEPSLRYDIIGCYSQTELGHGSNVQGLETTATWIPETQEFELHSPRLTSAKWWSGGLGTTATHSSVMAQLIINGKRFGPHPFVVPLRDLQTRKPLPGRRIGDIGPKMGYNTVDNGFLLLDHVRIPHNHFLAKYSTVDPKTGEYSKPAHNKLSYGTMTYIRAGIVMSSRDVIARAATIAIRYCAVRRQFIDKDSPAREGHQPLETQVLDYQMVQYRLLPVIALAYAFHFTGIEMYKLYESNMAAVKAGDFSLMADTHAFSSALKSYTTIAAASAIEDCRRACGGHGYSMAGGMASQYTDYLPQVTYEGDSYMLTQQVAKYLMNTFRTLSAQQEKEDPTRASNATTKYMARYLADKNRKAQFFHSGDCDDLDLYIDAFGYRAAHMLDRLVRLRDVEGRPWNALLVDMFKVSRAHAELLLVANFANVLRTNPDLQNKAAVRSVLHDVFQLFVCTTMDREIGDFLKSGFLSYKQAELIRNQLDSVLATIRPQAVPLVESFKLPDYLLNSALGRQDGNVYDALFSFACNEPLNAITWNPDISTTDTRMHSAPIAKL